MMEGSYNHMIGCTCYTSLYSTLSQYGALGHYVAIYGTIQQSVFACSTCLFYLF